MPDKPIQTVWACQAYWYFFFDLLQTIPPLLSDDRHR